MSRIAVKLMDSLDTSTSQKQTYNTLLSICSDVITTDDGLKYFKERKGPERVIEFLSKPNEKILNISLGILANCCVDEECRKKIISEGTMRQLASIMKFINQDKIHYRCCKLIGNLARYPELCSELMYKNVCNLLNQIVSGSPSINTQFVVMRCLRYISIGASPSIRKTILLCEVFRSSLRYLNSDSKLVQKMVLRVLFYISRSRSITVLKQIITEDLLKQIISLTTEYSSITLRIVYCLSEISCFHFKLVKAGVIEEIFSQVQGVRLKDLEPTEEMNMNFVLCAICRLSHEPKCRERIWSIPEAFDTLMDIVENSPYLKFKKYCVLILTSYIYYSEDMLGELVEQRLISALITYLRIIIDEEGVAHSNDDSNLKVDSSLPSCSPSSSGHMSPMSEPELSNSFSGSPLSEGFPTSPASSMDIVYSPVCSPSMDYCDEDNSEDESEKLSVGESSRADSPFTPQEDDIAKSCPEEKLFNLLKRISFSSKPIFDLCAQRTWETLLEYLVLVRKNSTLLKLLCSIAGNKCFFHVLFKSEFALTVHRKLCRPVHSDCTWCQEMEQCGVEILTRYRLIAESSLGELIILNELKNKNTTVACEVVWAVTIPHIVRNVYRLEEYLIRDGLLSILIDSLKEDAEGDTVLLEEKVESLISLARMLFIEYPRVPFTLCKKCDVASQTKEGTINFLLDDGSTVTANKSLICEKSEFFEAMFRCGFREATESVVRISNISSDCLRVLIRLLYSYCDCILPRNILVVLELIVQCDRFLMPALSKKLLLITMNNYLDYKNGYVIYDWAIENGSFLVDCDARHVCQNVIKHTLVSEMSHPQRVHSLKMLLQSRYKDNVLRDIYLLLEKQLTCKEVKTKSFTEYIWEGTAKRRKLV